MATKKSKAIREQADELRASLLELSEACPFHLDNPEDCQLFPLRKLNARKRLQWVNALSESDLLYLTTYHRVCLKIKRKSGLAKPRPPSQSA
ncbi:MAG: hypothetical protein WCQ21_36365 [Verrucomicrobiota bacterium]|jgi:hypothetical protein